MRSVNVISIVMLGMFSTGAVPADLQPIKAEPVRTPVPVAPPLKPALNPAASKGGQAAESLPAIQKRVPGELKNKSRTLMPPKQLQPVSPAGQWLQTTTPLVIPSAGKPVAASERYASMQVIRTPLLTLTGVAFEPVALSTPVLTLTGVAFKPVTLSTPALTLTGVAFEPVTFTTRALTLTGVVGD